MNNRRNYDRRYESAVARQVAYKMETFNYLKKAIKNKPEDFKKSEEYVKKVAEDTKHALGVRKDDDSKEKEISHVRKAALEVLLCAEAHLKKQSVSSDPDEAGATHRQHKRTDRKTKR